MFDGKVEIRRSSDNKVVMSGFEDEKLLKLQGTCVRSKNFSFMAHQEKGTLSSYLLWHARFGHLNFNNLCLLKQQVFSSLPTIPKNIEPCEACILGKHRKQPFVPTTWRA